MTLPTPREVLETLQTTLTEDTWLQGAEIELDEFNEGALDKDVCLTGGARLALARLLYSESFIDSYLNEPVQLNSRARIIILESTMNVMGLPTYDSMGNEISSSLPWDSDLAKLMRQVVTYLATAIHELHPDYKFVSLLEHSNYPSQLNAEQLEMVKKNYHVIMFNDDDDRNYEEVAEVIKHASKLAIQKEEKGGC